MRKKLTENFITILGCVGIIGTIVNLWTIFLSESINESSREIPESLFLNVFLSGKFIVGISFLVFVLIIGWFYFKKYHLIDMYGILYSMTRTNKLHSIREVIMVIFKLLQGKENTSRIDEAHFIYTILPTKEKDLTEKEQKRYRDIEYKLEFKFNNGRNILAKNSQNVFKFYFIIVNINNGRTAEDIEVLLESQTKEDIFLIPTITNVTVSEVDKIQNIASLYEMTISIPQRWVLRSSGPFWLKIKYRIPKDMDLAEEGNQKNFLIHPQNYAKSIKAFSTKIITEDLQFYQAELQSIYPDLNYENTGLRSELTFKKFENKDKKLEYSLPGELFLPYMKAVYIVQVEWKWADINKSAINTRGNADMLYEE